MANYQSAYTGAQIDTAVEKINNTVPVIEANMTALQTSLQGLSQDLQNKTSILELVTGDASSAAIQIGDLLIQRQRVVVPYSSTQTVSFPIPYPIACFAIWVTTTHGLPSSPFGSPNSIVCDAKSNSQFYIYQTSGSSNASMTVNVFSFGY